MIYHLREWDDAILRRIAEPVAEVDSGILRIVDNMVETMYAIGAAGLAANQCGVPLRIMLVDRRMTFNPPIIAINPRIVATSIKTAMNTEGCFSLPGVFGNVVRPKTVTLEALNQNGKLFSVRLADAYWESTAAQHELDHLDGILFIDHASEIWTDNSQITATYKERI